jgi:hypothetical protein
MDRVRTRLGDLKTSSFSALQQMHNPLQPADGTDSSLDSYGLEDHMKEEIMTTRTTRKTATPLKARSTERNAKKRDVKGTLGHM